MIRYMRRQRVAQMIQILTLEGIAVEQNDLVMLGGYVQGNVSGQDLLAHAHQFSSLLSYQEWLSIDIGKHTSHTNSFTSVEKIVTEVETFIRRKHMECFQNARMDVDAASHEQ